jgi:hypothetical protein
MLADDLSNRKGSIARICGNVWSQNFDGSKTRKSSSFFDCLVLDIMPVPPLGKAYLITDGCLLSGEVINTKVHAAMSILFEEKVQLIMIHQNDVLFFDESLSFDS